MLLFLLFIYLFILFTYYILFLIAVNSDYIIYKILLIVKNQYKNICIFTPFI